MNEGEDLARVRLLLRLRDESPGGPWFGTECTTLNPVVDVTYQTANASKKGADIGAGRVAVHQILFGRTKKRML